MKRKLDFVTNSSSTSFCGWGLGLEIYLSDMPESMTKFVYDKYIDYHKKYEKGIPVDYKTFMGDPGYYHDEYEYELAEFFKKNDLSCVSIGYDSFMYIGFEFKSVPEDMTIKEIKDETKERLEKLGFDTGDFKLIDEAWRDG